MRLPSIVALWLVCLLSGFALPAGAQEPVRWLAHDMQRPRPPVVAPAASDCPAPPPADAVVLFDGKDLSGWRDAEGGPAKWIARDGYMESVPNSGYIYSAGKFGDVQLHVEWAAPLPAKGRSQGRGNSGVFLMGLYEVQVLDSYDNETYADGQAAAIYGQYPPLVNACRPPGEWQSYDIFFRRPRFHADGTVERKARITVVHNGILVQDNVEIWGPTAWLQNRPYEPQEPKLPISLQDHGNPVRYRNLWLRELPETPPAGPPASEPPPVVALSTAELQEFVGAYKTLLGDFGKIELHGEQLQLHMETGQVIDLIPRSPTEFAFRWTAAKLDFDVRDGKVAGFTMHLAGDKYPVKRVGG
ncbi:MAG: DUF1080 domain-containing protein [Planctomycetaceae bacterium]|nr:DUF1080 domain-containing protein [Planctomycetaceae bacterium]